MITQPTAYNDCLISKLNFYINITKLRAK